MEGCTAACVAACIAAGLQARCRLSRYRDLIACSRQAHHCVMQHNEEPRPLKCILESLARVLRRAGDADRNGVFSDSSQSL